MNWIQLISSISLFFLVLASGKKEHSFENSKIPFGFDWKLALEDHSIAGKPGFDDSERRLLNVPADSGSNILLTGKTGTLFGQMSGYYTVNRQRRRNNYYCQNWITTCG